MPIDSDDKTDPAVEAEPNPGPRTTPKKSARGRWLVRAFATLMVLALVGAGAMPVSYTHLTLPTNREV